MYRFVPRTTRFYVVNQYFRRLERSATYISMLI